MDAIERLRRLVGSGGAAGEAAPALGFGAEIEEAVAYLGSEEAARSLAADPYWPKWDGPWWHMLLLWELGEVGRIPAAAAAGLVRSARAHLHTSFPFRIEEVPAGIDPIRGTSCHCQLGTMVQVLAACGVDVDRDFPWVRGWFLRYQLPDGGLNCDEAAYTRPTPRSSLVSTLPALEAILRAAPRPLAPAEWAFLDRGAEYLLRRALCRSLSRGGGLIDAAWLAPTFPRFYEYDVLRGLSFVVEWALARPEAVLRAADIAEAAAQFPEAGPVCVGRQAWAAAGTLRCRADGTWGREPKAARFPLLEAVGAPGIPAPALTASWRGVVAGLRELESRGRLQWV
ncbi:MAG: hypothetical protein HZA54_08270 [Planctomycetes bacterium]|nr:hypothetical protein [Planctomycetota bacterium]